MKCTGKGFYGVLIIAVLSLAILAGCGDTTAPTNTTASNFIDSGASSTSSTTVTLAISATDSAGITGYYASETSTAPSASATGWTSVTSTTSYSASVSFTLSSGDGEKTAYVWFKDAAGNVSAAASDTITLSTAVTASDFVGTWMGSYSNTIVYTNTTTVAETGSGNLTMVLALSNGSLTGTLTDSNANEWTTGATIFLTDITVTNGTLSFPVQNTQSSDPDCANWNITSTATLDSSMANMNFGMSGTVCSDLAGGEHKSIGAFSSTLTKQTTSVGTASGTYTWDSTTGIQNNYWTSLNFVCGGPEDSITDKTGVTITSTTMTNDGGDTWTRPSGTAGDIIGTWTFVDSTTGYSETLTFNTDGTVFLVGNIVSCSTNSSNPSTQVANNSGGRIDHVNVGNVTFSDNLSYNISLYTSDNGSYCGDGCSTGFLDVAEGTNNVVVYQTATSTPVSVGSLGSFVAGNEYAVNIRDVSGSYCAELWQRLDASTHFNDDTTRVLIATTCP